MRLVTTGEMAEIDREAQDRYGIPGVVLMEGAAIRCAQILEDLATGRLSFEDLSGFSDFDAFRALRVSAGSPASCLKKTAVRPVVFVAGKGHNGGDALAMARLCEVDGRFPVSVILGQRDPGGVTGEQLRSCTAMGLPISVYEDDPGASQTQLEQASWIVDGVSGTGLRGALREPLAALVNAINRSGTPVFSIDTPSGAGDSFRKEYPCVRAAVTATIGLPKRCLFLPAVRPLCGRVIAVPISFPRALTENAGFAGEILTKADLPSLFPPIDAWTYKTRRGHLGVFAGAPGTAGAAVLAATAAARSRTGLVTLHIEPAIYDAVASSCTSVMALPWHPDEEHPGDLLPGAYSACLVGPGWGRNANRSAWLKALVGCGIPGVLDADGLNIFSSLDPAEIRGLAFQGRWVLTPHPGEFARMRGKSSAEFLDNPVQEALTAATELNAIIVLKGHVTTIASPSGRYWLVDGMNAAMATGGTGDVLSGIIAGLLASGVTPIEAAKGGVLLHQEVGRIAFKERGWFISEDLLTLLSRVLAMFQKQG
ncbi:MAG TPA: NAD(P)H-hydrate dehydratase [Spirochaetia bacterium]|nr:NAD(P)H-hydrate dehydratase [Spirochaetia bacterium]